MINGIILDLLRAMYKMYYYTCVEMIIIHSVTTTY